jgi:kynurenine formamidase
MRSSHLGTHVDAPLHYGSMCEGKPSRTISDISVQELFCDGFVLDVRDACEPGEAIPVEALAGALEENGAPLTPGCAVLLRTGQENYAIDDPRWYVHRGNSREGTLFLADAGAKVLGTDASWDRPFPVMRKLYEETGDPEVLWDGHRAGRDKEVFIVQKLENLRALPPNGFKVGFFPIKLRGASGAPARVVAFVND